MYQRVVEYSITHHTGGIHPMFSYSLDNITELSQNYHMGYHGTMCFPIIADKVCVSG